MKNKHKYKLCLSLTSLLFFYYFLHMIHFLLPRNSSQLYKYIHYQSREDTGETTLVVSNSLSYYLKDIKTRIDNQEAEWDTYKRYTNPYEYIHTTVPGKRKCISKVKPLSRSFFKMIELIQFFRLLDVPNIDRHNGKSNNSRQMSARPIRSFHLAEGPGGFIEALAHIRKNSADEYVGMTILDDVHDPNIPAWKKSQQFLQEHPNVFIENGQDGTGNILSIENFDYCYEKYGSSMDFISGDGGFDFSIDFNNQEQHIAQLLFGQMAYALCMQKRGGCFVLKVFDCFMQHTLDILAILSSFYEKVYITKPQTSRYANSEKYVVCKGFFGNVGEFMPTIRTAFKELVDPCNRDTSVLRFLSVPLSLLFLNKMEEFNAIFGQQQIENIHHTLLLIDNRKHDKIENLIKLNVQRCIHWCTKYNIPYYMTLFDV